MNTARLNNFLFGLVLALIVPSLLWALSIDAWWPLSIPLLILLAFIGWHRPSWLMCLLWISIPLSVEYSFSDQLGTDLPDEPLMLAMTVLSLFYLIARGRPFSSALWRHPLFICFLLWMGWMGVACLLSTAPTLSIKFLLAKSWYTGAFFLAPLIWLRDRKSIEQFLYFLFIPLFLIALLSLIRHAFHGFRFIDSSNVVQPFFRNHVVYSAMLVTLVPVLFFSWRFTSYKKSWIAALILILTALFFSYARGAWLALLVAAIAYGLIRKRALFYAYLVSVLLGVMAILWLKQEDRYLSYAPDYKTTIFHNEFQDHWRATYEGKDVSTVERFYRWIAGVRMVEKRPWTGFGPASFYVSYKPFTVPAYKTWVSDNTDRSTVHNYFLLTAVEQGIPGLIIFLILFGSILYYAERYYHTHQKDWSRQLAAGVGVVTVMLGVVNFWSDLIETDKFGSLFFLSISLLLVLHQKRSSIGSDIERVA
ncbi:MAG: O-antigen ligase family protein [Bacteroidota bacterium]